jgi:hypothetical protein
MSQMTWTYIADDGSLHKVGLFHGDNTGHLLIYCNASIMVIDFSVHSTRNYSFFINDELCDIEVEEKEGKFYYGFKVDQITDTPRNRVRRRLIREEVRQSLLIGTILIVVILLATWLIFRFNS